MGFFSKALSGSERNYAAYEVELYAVIRAVEHFRMFLLGKEFLRRTDHAALRNLFRRDLSPAAGSNDGYYVTQNTTLKLYIREAKTMSSQTSSLDCPSQLQKVSRNYFPSTNFLNRLITPCQKSVDQTSKINNLPRSTHQNQPVGTNNLTTTSWI